jgi:5'-3' exonuclease
VTGVGETHARRLIQTYGDLEACLLAASQHRVLPARLGKLLALGQASALLSKQLVRLDQDLDLDAALSGRAWQDVLRLK